MKDNKTTEQHRSETFLNKPLQTPQMQKISLLMSNYSAEFAEMYTALKLRGVVNNDSARSLSKAIIHDIEGIERDMKQFILYGMQGKSDFSASAVCVACITALLGKRLSYNQNDLNDLVTGALLHDIGMIRIPEEILGKDGSLSEEEQRTIQTYPSHSYRIITGELSLPDDIGIIALHHQERWSGGGYPRGLNGNNISFNARIVAVADAFEAMLSTRPYRSSMDGYNAVRAILRDNGQRFDPEIIKVFIQTFGIYPRGCLVLLNDSAIGRVIEIHPDTPLRPQVKIMISNEGREYLDDEGPVVDLRDEKRMFIARPINREQLQVASNTEHA